MTFMDFNQIRYFLKLADTLNFTRAAEQCFVSQPALTQAIKRLEVELGGELVDPSRTTFKNLNDIDFVGAYPSYAEAHDAWKAAAQRTVDNAHARYFILHAHELIDPDQDGIIG